MSLSFRLKEILREHGLDERGIISAISEAAQLERHKVSLIVRNQTGKISLDTMAALSRFLVDHLGFDPESVPGALFTWESEEFWELLTDPKYLEICFGVRTNKKAEHRSVVEADAFLHGLILNGMADWEASRTTKPKTRQRYEQRMVSTYGPAGAISSHDLNVARRDGHAAYSKFQERSGSTALLCLGSTKSNSVIEYVFARTFEAKAFEPEIVGDPRTRSCPVFLRYRAEDVHPPSCLGGTELARGPSRGKPGILYEDAGGEWHLCPCDDTHDVALVFYVYFPSQRRVEMAIGGFSARATRCLATELRRLAHRLWPPTFRTPEKQCGAFVVRFNFRERTPKDGGLVYPKPSRTKVIPVASEALARRLS